MRKNKSFVFPTAQEIQKKRTFFIVFYSKVFWKIKNYEKPFKVLTAKKILRAIKFKRHYSNSRWIKFNNSIIAENLKKELEEKGYMVIPYEWGRKVDVRVYW